MSVLQALESFKAVALSHRDAYEGHKRGGGAVTTPAWQNEHLWSPVPAAVCRAPAVTAGPCSSACGEATAAAAATTATLIPVLQSAERREGSASLQPFPSTPAGLSPTLSCPCEAGASQPWWPDAAVMPWLQ